MGNLGGISAKELREALLKDIKEAKSDAVPQAKEVGEQVGESFADGIEHGMEDAASKIAASSVKITKAFRDLAKKVSEQKILINGSNITVDFSKININSEDFQKKVNEAFEEIKINSNIKFDSKAAEKQFKDMLGLYIKYSDKLAALRDQKPKLTNSEHIKANAKEQLAVISGLKEIRRLMDNISDISISLPHVYLGDTKSLQTEIDLIDRLAKGEEKIGKQRDTNAEKIRKENKELKERNKILEEKVGPIEESPALKSKRSRVKSNMAKNAIPDYSMLPKEGKMILYHNTSSKNVGSIIKNGLRADAGKEQGRGKDGDLVWATTVPNQKGYGGNTIAFQIDVKLLADNPQWKANEDEYHIPIDIPAEDILFVDRPINNVQRESDVAELVRRHGADKVKNILGKGKTNDDVSTDRLNELADAAAVKSAEEARLAKEREETEKHALELARQRAEEEARIAAEKAASQGATGTQQEIKSQEELQKEIEKTNRIIKNQKEWLKDLDYFLNDENFKTSGKKDATERLRTRSSALLDFRQHPDRYNYDSDINIRRELALSQAYKEAERQGVAQSTLSRFFSDAVIAHDENIKKLQEERALHAKLLDDAEKRLEFAKQQLSISNQNDAVNSGQQQAEQVQNIVQLTDNYGESLDEVNNKLMQGTKLLNEQGQILRLFHNSPEVFDKFDTSKSGSHQGTTLGKGNYLSLKQDSKYNDPIYGRYQTQWYANLEKIFEAGKDILSPEQINSLIDKFLPGLSEGDKQKYLSKFTDKYMAQAVRFIANKAKVETEDVWRYLGYDAIKSGDEINIFDSSKIHRANNTVLDIGDVSDFGQMSMLPAVEKEIEVKEQLAATNDKVAKSQKKIKEAAQGTQMTIDDIVPASAEDIAPKVESEVKSIDKVGKAADKAAGSKKKFAKANKEVAASISPSVSGLETEADAMEDVGEVAKKTSKVVSEEAKRAAESMSFSTDDYTKLYEEMKAFAEQRRDKEGFDQSKVSVKTDALERPIGATISYYNKETNESIIETFQIASDETDRLILKTRQVTKGIAEFNKANLKAIKNQNNLMSQKNKTLSTLSSVLDPNANRTLAGTKYEDEAKEKIQAIRDEVAKLDHETNGVLSEEDFIAIKRRIDELTQDARDFINQSKNAEYAPTQLESHSVSSGNQYRADQLKAQINEWKRAGIYVGDLKTKAEDLAQSVTNITKHEDLKKYLEGMKEARALAKLATQDKKAEEERQKALNKEYEEYISLIAKRDAIESKMIGLDAAKNKDELAALRADYDAVDNELNDKYGDFLSRKDVQERFTIGELASTDDAARRKMAIKEGQISDKKRLEEEVAAQQKINEKYQEYIRLIQERGRKERELVGLDPKKNKEQINTITARIDEIDESLNKTYGDLLSNKIAQATLTLEDFMKYYDKWQQEIAEKEAKAADKARNKAEKPYLDYGKTTANSAVRKRDNLQGEIDALGITNPEVLAKIDVYNAKVQEVVDLRAKFENDPEAAKDPALVKQFQKASAEAERTRRGIKAVIDEEQRLIQLSKEQGFDPIKLSADQMANIESAMIAQAKATAQGRVEIKGWNADHTKMNYTVTNSKGVVEEMTMALGQGKNRMYQYRTATKETGTLIEQVFKGIKVKAKELLSFVIGGGSVYKVIELLRQGIQYVREIDLALTELKKVTDETEESYDKFLDTAAKTGARLGSTISAVTEATATFAKLGYTMEQATEMAEAAIVYKNVGDNIASTEDAADSIISTMKGFKLEATESMEIVDRFNEVGNRFAITSQGIGEALRLSASALSEGGNSLDESIGLITAANEVVNDPSSVGTALKTLTLRLRGSKTELEEMGEDVSDMATTTSQLQAKLLALTGGQVDIMADANTFKNSTQILREMADAWEDMTDIQRASALELMGGKRQANVLSALIQNFDTVEKVIETSADSAGSALKENERYLDSIQGKIDQFNNALQAMWSNFLNADVVKDFVAFGTEIVKIIDEIGLLGSALIALAAYKGFGAVFDVFRSAGISVDFLTKKLGSYVFGINTAAAAETTLTQAQVAQRLAQQGLTAEQAQAIAAQTGLATSTANLSRETLIASLQAKGYSAAEAEAIAAKIFGTAVTNASTGALIQETIQLKLANSALVRYAIQMGYVTAAEVANMGITQLLGLSFSTLAKTIGAATVALAKFLFTNPVGWAILAVGALAGGIAAWNKWGDTTENLSEELSNLKSELQDIESEIDSLNSELEAANERMAELIAMPSLSFIEQEELNNLKLATAELERQLKLKEMLADSKEDTFITTSEQYINKVWNSNGVDKSYHVSSDGTIRKDEGWHGFWNAGENTKSILDSAIKGYETARIGYDRIQTVLSQWSDDEEKNKELLKQYGFQEYTNKKALEEIAEGYKKRRDKNAEGINMILGDEKFDNLEYGMSDEIDAFLDELYAYGLKFRQAQGEYIKSEAISTMFDSSSTGQMQEFGKALKEIANSDLTDEEKNVEILKQLDGIDGVIGDGVNKIEGKTDAYNRLHLAMETVGVTAQDIADYFVLHTGAFDSNTIEGITNQYQHMESVINSLKSMSDGKFTLDGVEYNWEQFFSRDDQGKFKANTVEFSNILKGMDEKSRKTFINIVESAANSAGDLSKINWDQALSKLDFSGIDRTFELLNNEFEALNNDMFAGAADDINGLIDTVSELQAALEDVASTMDLVHTAQNQMNSSGRISMKTALGLMQTTEDWDKVLKITNGTIELRDGAEQHLIQTELTAIQTQLQYAWTTAQARYETALAAQGELDYANNSGVVMTAESIKAEAIGRVSAVVVALGAAMDELMAGNWGSVFSAFGDTYKTATETVVQDSQKLTTSVAELQKDAEEKKKMYDAFSSVDSLEEFTNNYDFDEDPGDKYGDSKNDAFQKEMDYWENRIGANQARYEQLQNEIDLMEAKGQKADASYYEEQIKLENERKWLLEQQKAAAEAHLATLTEGSEEWWEVANTLNDIEAELDDVTASIVDLQDAIGEIDSYKFEEFNTRLDDIINKLGTIRDLIAPDGEEDWFDEQGDWTEEGVAVLGTYIQELETYKQGLAEAEDAYADYVKEYAGNEKYYATLGIHSEQELYDKRQELIEQQYDYAQSISDTEQSVVDMYESNIDAIEEYTDALIDSYNDYIDSVKEALEAERDLYDFKKNVQKQSKDIAAIERRIASLSGSTNASDVAERRKLEAELYDSRESLNDTYYDHARSAQDEALDAEQTAYEESMTKFVEGLRTSLETATLNMDEFLMSVTSMVTLNADTVLTKYQETELPLGDAITNPWEAAKAAVGNYSGDALALMNQWTTDGFFDNYNKVVGNGLSSPWTAGSNAAGAFKTSVDTVMEGVVSKIATNVKTASGELSKLYQQILDTEKRAAEADVTVDNTNNQNNTNYDPPFTPHPIVEKPEIKLRGLMKTSKEMILGPKSFVDARTETINGKDYYRADDTGYYYEIDDLNKNRKYDGGRTTGWSIPKGTWFHTKHAKGTTGTARDQWAITDEPQFGDELVLVPGKDGNLSFMRKGTGVVPADMTQKLFELAQIPTSDLMSKNLTAIVPNITKNDFKNEFNFESLVHVDTVDSDTLPKLEKMMDKKIDDFSRALNYSLKKFAR